MSDVKGQVAFPAADTLIGIDVGGTFTDLFVYRESDRSVSVHKVPSARGDEARGFLHGLAVTGVPAHQIATLIHGTTVATNALLERRVARCGVITTRGFRDVLEMRRRDRPATWGLRGTYQPVVPRQLRLEVDERVLADGSVLEEVQRQQVQEAARQLLGQGCTAVCIFFINAYANVVNEQKAAQWVREIWPNPFVTCASEVLPEIREFERCSTAVLNACLQPLVGQYLANLAAELKASNFAGDFLIVQSSGGVMSAQTAAELPVRTALSGPAAGVIACARIASAAGYADVITGDVGGTSFDVSLIEDSRAALASQTAIEFGLVIRAPMIQIETIGAGGGSIAGVNAAGMLSVGPESAGSRPGPACYGRGGMRATVTDANLLLGRIDGNRPIGGASLGVLDRELARAAIERDVAMPLGLDVLAAAEAILTIANARMAGAIRLISIEKGHDPRRFTYLPFGGGGALHVCAMLREVGMQSALIPRYPGVTSALGCILADMRHDRVQTLSRPLEDLQLESLRGHWQRMASECTDRLDASRLRFEAREEIIELDMQYAGQTHAIAVALDRALLQRSHPTGPEWRVVLRARFDEAYAKAFGRTLGALPVRVVNLRYALIGRRPVFDLRALAPQVSDTSEPQQRAVFHDGRWQTALVFNRLELPVDAAISGPAILQQPDTTIWLEPGFSGRVDDHGNLIVRPTP